MAVSIAWVVRMGRIGDGRLQGTIQDLLGYPNFHERYLLRIGNLLSKGWVVLPKDSTHIP